MSGWEDLQAMKRLEAQADKNGFKLTRSKYSDHYTDLIGLVPKDADSLPIYNREAELFSGSSQQILIFLKGLEWAREYDVLMKVSTPKKRETQEQKERNRQLAKAIKESS